MKTLPRNILDYATSKGAIEFSTLAQTSGTYAFSACTLIGRNKGQSDTIFTKSVNLGTDEKDSDLLASFESAAIAMRLLRSRQIPAVLHTRDKFLKQFLEASVQDIRKRIALIPSSRVKTLFEEMADMKEEGCQIRPTLTVSPEGVHDLNVRVLRAVRESTFNPPIRRTGLIMDRHR